MHDETEPDSGTYRGNYFGGQETLTLNPNGTFNQVFVFNGTNLYQNQDNRSVQGQTVKLMNFIPVLFYFKFGQSPEKLRPLGSFNGTVKNRGDVIVFYDDADFLVRRS